MPFGHRIRPEEPLTRMLPIDGVKSRTGVIQDQPEINYLEILYEYQMNVALPQKVNIKILLHAVTIARMQRP